MRILFSHPNFPAQFVHLASYYGHDKRNQVAYLTAREDLNIDGVHKVLFKASREPSPQTHHYLRNLEAAVLQGQAAYRAASQLKAQGFVPDVMMGHSGWGSTMYLKDLFPNTPLIGYFEWFYHAHGSDAEFGADERLSPDAECRIRMQNSPILVDLYSSDAGISPTYWQHSQFPVEYTDKIRVIHDGVNTKHCAPNPQAKLVLPEQQLDLSEVKEIITYVGRGMEPYRGFPQFMEAVALVLAKRPNCHVVIVGADRVVYGSAAPGGKSYKELMLEKLNLDMSRVHFTGLLPKNLYRLVLQASSVHVYLTRPFVLSWSMLEAMSTGCLLVASNTPPVTEVINDGVNGLLADFFSPHQIADRICEALDNPRAMMAIRKRARETVLERYDLQKMLSKQLSFINEVVQTNRK